MKEVIPHNCKFCGCELWYDNGFRNYVYRENKSGYWYQCNNVNCISERLRR